MSAINNGFVKVNNEKISNNYVFQQNDLLQHKTHRHEPPILGDIVLVGESESLVAVSKPPSVPMHPCGAYRYNSVMSIICKYPLIANQPQLHLVHRLDRYSILINIQHDNA